MHRSVRDPRFRRTDDKSENEHAMRNYGFVFNEVIPEERRNIKSALKVSAVRAQSNRTHSNPTHPLFSPTQPTPRTTPWRVLPVRI